MKLSDIKPKHLVLGQEYDDFSKATDEVDFDVEDLCCQVVGLTSVYYWINTESVWGPLGFIWTQYNNYGQFSKSTIPFTIIPKIPDSYRHQTLRDIFDNIDNDLIFLDSGWEHITNFYRLRNKGNLITVDWHCDSISNLENILRYGNCIYTENYILRASLPNTTINYNFAIYLIDENKNNLKLNIIPNNFIYSTSIDTSKLTKSDNFDIRDYIKFNNVYINDRIIINLYNGIKNLILESVGIYTYYSNYYYYISPDIYITYGSSSNPCDNVTYILNHHKYNSDIKSLRNNNLVYSKHFTYININNEIYINIDYYYKYGIFTEGTPEITQEIINFCTTSVFYRCNFYLPYQYGTIKAIYKVFGEYCSDNTWNETKNGLYTIGFTRSNNNKYTIKLVVTNEYPIYNSTLFQFTYTHEDYQNNQRLSVPSISNLSVNNSFYWVDIKIPFLELGSYTYYKYSPSQYTTSEGDIVYHNCYVNKLFIWNNNNTITFNNDTGLSLGWSYLNNDITISCLICMNNSTFPDNKFIFNINEDNITESKTEFNNTYLWLLCKLFEYTIPYIVRNNSYQFKYTNYELSASNKYKLDIQQRLWPDLDTIPLIYYVNIEVTYDDNEDYKLPNELVQHVLDNIITVGDINDAQGRTIKLLSEYYQNIKEETKTRLISDGYTIIEVL